MRRSIEGLFRDLLGRVGHALERLDAGTDPYLTHYAERTRSELVSIAARVEEELSSGQICESGRQVEMAKQLRRLSTRLSLVERFELPCLGRFDATDLRMNRLVDQLQVDVGWPLGSPLVGCFSNSYYWINPERMVMGLPINEERRLLGLPDLCHELGHVLLENSRETLLEQFLDDLLQYVTDNSDKLEDEVEFLLGWLEAPRSTELACDVIGAWLAGPAYGYQHLRLCAGTASYVYVVGGGQTHPADDARARVIAETLRYCGRESGAKAFEERWDEYLEAQEEDPSGEYELTFPQELVESIVKSVSDGADETGLRPFDPEASAASDVPALMNLAWEKLHDDPNSYESWESEQLEELWQRLGVEKDPAASSDDHGL